MVAGAGALAAQQGKTDGALAAANLVSFCNLRL